ncbi:hypothetical protein [Noviherbaspirillum galbum]|nr:hypothetical protein [Noviherbaspirillum galbum]
MILSRNADKFGVDLDDLKQDVWMVFQEKMLAILDSPANVYSVLYRCSELCSRSLVNGVRETTLAVGDDEDVNEVMHRLIEANGAVSDSMDATIEIDLDTHKARLAVQQKLAAFGWPQDIPRDESAYRRAGRPLKESRPLQRGMPTEPMEDPVSRSLINPDLKIEPIDPATIPHFQRRDGTTSKPVSEAAQQLFDMREKIQVPIAKFAEMVNERPEMVRSLFYGAHKDDDLARTLTKRAKTVLSGMRKDPDMTWLLTHDMAAVYKRWKKLWQMPDEFSTIRAIAHYTGRMYPTMRLWLVQNRKPINIFDLYDLDRLVRALTKKVHKEQAEGGEAWMVQFRIKPRGAPPRTKTAASAAPAAQAVPKKAVVTKATSAKTPAAKKIATVNPAPKPSATTSSKPAAKKMGAGKAAEKKAAAKPAKKAVAKKAARKTAKVK